MKTLALKHLQLPNLDSCSEPSDGASIVDHGTNELLIEQNTVPDGQAVPSVQETVQHPQPLEGLLSYLVVVGRPSQPHIKGHTQIASSINPHD